MRICVRLADFDKFYKFTVEACVKARLLLTDAH
jgi:hypothetical protein